MQATIYAGFSLDLAIKVILAQSHELGNVPVASASFITSDNGLTKIF